MRVLLYGFGSRGDVQPFIALGKGLQRAGYDVTLSVGRNFESWVRSEGLTFQPIAIDMEALVQTDTAKDWIDGRKQTAVAEVRSMKRMFDGVAAQVAEDVLAALDHFDTFISGVLTVEAMNAAAAVRGKTCIVGTMTPWTPTRSGASGMNAPIPRGDSVVNLIFGYVVEAMMSNVFGALSRAVRANLKLRPSTPVDYMRAWNQAPTLMGISPLVTPHPPDWGDNLHVTGYWFLDRAADWQPPPELTAFLDSGDPPVYIGFGSMSSRDPESTLRLMLAAIEKTGQRTLIHSGWAGMRADDLPPNVRLIDSVPHDWLFPRMAAVIHHGGAGTTAAGLRAGVPSAVIAHIGDQPYWGRRIHELGVGAPPIRRHALTVENLSETIRLLTTDREMRVRAAAFGEQIRAEDGIGNAVRAFAKITGT